MIDWNPTDLTPEEMAALEAQRQADNHGYQAGGCVTALTAFAVLCLIIWYGANLVIDAGRKTLAAAQSRPAAVSYPTRAIPTDKPMPTDAPTIAYEPTERPTIAPTPYPTFTPLPTATERVLARPVATVDPARAVQTFKTFQIVGGDVLILIGICIAVALFRWVWLLGDAALENKRLAREQRKQITRPLPEPPAPVINQYNSDAGHTVMQKDAPRISLAEKRVIQRQLKAGRRLVLNERNGMIPKENGFSRTRLTEIINELETAGMGTRTRDGSLEFTFEGRKYFDIPENQ